MYVIPDTYYTINVANKTITLIAPYNMITIGQISSILDITSGTVIYDVTKSALRDPSLSATNGVITFSRTNGVSNTDKLRIVLESTTGGIDGGSA